MSFFFRTFAPVFEQVVAFDEQREYEQTLFVFVGGTDMGCAWNNYLSERYWSLYGDAPQRIMVVAVDYCGGVDRLCLDVPAHRSQILCADSSPARKDHCLAHFSAAGVDSDCVYDVPWNGTEIHTLHPN